MSEDNRNWTTTEKLTVEENGTIGVKIDFGHESVEMV